MAPQTTKTFEKAILAKYPHNTPAMCHFSIKKKSNKFKQILKKKKKKIEK
jgi:hypothetical protein